VLENLIIYCVDFVGRRWNRRCYRDACRCQLPERFRAGESTRSYSGQCHLSVSE